MSRRRVENSLSYGHPHLYAKSGPGTILQDVTMASMSGTLAQLGLVSHYAAELFEDLFVQSKELYDRVDRVQTRTGKLLDQLSAVSTKMNSLDGTTSSVQVPHEIEAPDRVAFDEKSMPRSMRERYQDVSPVPDFSGIDALLPQEGPCSQKYSYPGLFLDQWAAEEMKRISAIKAQRAEKKAGRKEKKKRPSSIKGPSKWKDRYNVEGEESQRTQKSSPRPSSSSSPQQPANATKPSPAADPSLVAPPTSKETQGASQIKMQRPSLIPSPPSAASSQRKTKTPSPPSFKRPPPPPLPPTIGTVTREEEEEEEEEEMPTKPSRGASGGEEASANLQKTKKSVDEEEDKDEEDAGDEFVVGASKASKENQEYAKFFTMLRLHIPKEAVAQKMRNEGFDPAVLDDDSDDDSDDGVSAGGAAAAAASSLPPPPPPPPPPAMRDDDESTASSSPRPSLAADSPTQSPAKMPVAPRPAAAGLLGAIQQGKTLKKVEINKGDDEPAPKNDLLAAIKAGATLRKRDPEPLENKKPQQSNPSGLFGAVDKILSLRDKMEIDSDSEDDSDDWDDDDSDF